MIEELSGSIADLITSIESTIKREYDFVKSDDWSTIKEDDKRTKRHKLHWDLTAKATQNAKKIHVAAKADLKHPRIKALLKVLLDVFELYAKRGEKYFVDKDWTKDLIDENGSEINASFEISFQNELSNNIFSGKSTLKGVNFSSDVDSFDPELYNKQIAPLCMSKAFCEKYPEVQEIMDKKLSKNVQSNTRKSRKTKT